MARLLKVQQLVVEGRTLEQASRLREALDKYKAAGQLVTEPWIHTKISQLEAELRAGDDPRQEYANLLAAMHGGKLAVSCQPASPVMLPAGGGNVRVVIRVADGDLPNTLRRLRLLLGRLAPAGVPRISVSDSWEGPGDRGLTSLWTVEDQQEDQQPYDFSSPGRYQIDIIRTVRIRVENVPADVQAALNRQAVLKGSVVIDVRAAEATGPKLAGRWSGNMAVQVLRVDAARGQQGCDLTPQVRGKQILMTLDLAGASGEAALNIQPPPGTPGEKLSAKLIYQSSNGTFSARGTLQRGTITFTGQLSQHANGWALGGDWNWTVAEDGQTGRGSGTWSVRQSGVR